ncbi:late histone H1 isoform X2 [Eurytemora carolleeae]|uniref:late histone H1 isoform X2 n=1 Tax=Eurytemora carolleeae TaxID=1294199 RepID=UPI000C7657DF|nr:late histone H1 isoform X2 [Eurytemora carolleeae]|eukprot:XP_023330664.1 late histone H1-like isoform X2 [Eurytemora affinis]
MSGEKNEKLSYLMMAKEAIQTEKSRNGTSKQAILKHVVDTYKVDVEKAKLPLGRALKKGVESGDLKMAKESGKGANSYKLGDKDQEKKSKPTAAKTKAATEKKTKDDAPKLKKTTSAAKLAKEVEKKGKDDAPKLKKTASVVKLAKDQEKKAKKEPAAKKEAAKKESVKKPAKEVAKKEGTTKKEPAKKAAAVKEPAKKAAAKEPVKKADAKRQALESLSESEDGQDGPASPVKMAKKDPVKKPVPVISESEEDVSVTEVEDKLADTEEEIEDDFEEDQENIPPPPTKKAPAKKGAAKGKGKK